METVGKNYLLKPAIEDNRDFNITMMKADPGKSSSQHDHKTVECFIVLTGTWAIILGDNGEEAITLKPFDIFSVPPGVMRGVKNVGSEPGYILAILGGTNPGRPKWSQSINEKARQLGLYINEAGDLVRIE